MNKKQFLYLVTFVTLCAALFSACNKEPDYREKWVGQYMGEYIFYKSYFLDGTTYDTINECVINISIWQDSCLLIKMHHGAEYKPKINVEGYFEQYDGEPYNNSICNGNIRNFNIDFRGHSRISPNFSSGYSFKGKKQ